jgi:hypothetical protein
MIHVLEQIEPEHHIPETRCICVEIRFAAAILIVAFRAAGGSRSRYYSERSTAKSRPDGVPHDISVPLVPALFYASWTV